VRSSIKDTALVNRHHVLYVDKSIFASMSLEDLQGLLDEIAQVEHLALGVMNLVSKVHVHLLVEIENGQDLSVVRH